MSPALRWLVVDDDDVDTEGVRRAFTGLGLAESVRYASDGEEGLRLLEEMAGGGPCAVLLDLRLPRVDGFEFLEALQRFDPPLPALVFVLTTSDAGRDVRRTYELGAVAHFVKGASFQELRRQVRLIVEFCRCVELPLAAEGSSKEV